MKAWLFILLFFSLIVSCTDPRYSSSATFEVTNQTKIFIDSVLIQPDRGKLKYFSLEPNATKLATINLNDLGDGAYGVTYKLGNQSKSAVFGYFSNGLNVDSVHKIYIQTDTVVYKTK